MYLIVDIFGIIVEIIDVIIFIIVDKYSWYRCSLLNIGYFDDAFN